MTGASGFDTLEPRRLFAIVTVAPSGAQFTDIQAAIDAAAEGDTVSIAPGTYNLSPVIRLGSQRVIFLDKSVNLVGTGNPDQITLVTPDNHPAVYVTRDNITLSNFTVNGGTFGIFVQDAFRGNGPLTNITLRNLRVNPALNPSGAHGIVFTNVSDSVIDSCVVGKSYANGLFLDANSRHNLVVNNTINGSETQHALALKNSSDNLVLNNTVNDSGFHGIFLLTASRNRVEGNVINNPKFDSITATTGSNYNYIALNRAVSQGRANNLNDGTGVFINSESNFNYIYANTNTGSAEGGVAIFSSSNNVFEGNAYSDSIKGGFQVKFNTGQPDLTTGNRPDTTVITRNSFSLIPNNAGVIITDAANTTVSFNYVTGVGEPKVVNGGILSEQATNVSVFGNTIRDVKNSQFYKATNTTVRVFQNRTLSSDDHYSLEPSTVRWHAGPAVGGNFWSDSPSTTAYTNFIRNNQAGRGGQYIDRYPFASESLGRASTISITEPAASSFVTPGQTLALRWRSGASVLADISLSSPTAGNFTIASDVPDTGVYLWTVPNNLPAASDYSLVITPNNSAGQVIGDPGIASGLTVTPNGPVLLSPDRLQRASTGEQFKVAWSDSSNSAVDVLYRASPSATPVVLASGVTVNYATVTLPDVSNGTGQLLLRKSGVITSSAGVRPIPTAATLAFTGVQAGAASAGDLSYVTWDSPASTASVRLEYLAGGTTKTIVSAIPDTGSFDWILPDEGVTAQFQLRATFLNEAGATLSTVTTNPVTLAGSDGGLPDPDPLPTNAVDLVLNNLKATLPAVPAPGLKFRASFALNNAGTTALNQTVPVAFYLSTDGTTSGTPFTTVNLPASLGVNRGKGYTTSLTLPSTLPTADYQLIARVNPNATIPELNGNNNTVTRAGAALQAPRNDLSITFSTVPAQLTGTRRPARVIVTVRNNGNVTATANSAQLRLFQSIDNQLSENDRQIAADFNFRLRLNAGRTVRFTVTPRPVAGSFDTGSFFLAARFTAALSPGDNNSANDLAFSSTQVLFA